MGMNVLAREREDSTDIVYGVPLFFGLLQKVQFPLVALNYDQRQARKFGRRSARHFRQLSEPPHLRRCPRRERSLSVVQAFTRDLRLDADCDGVVPKGVVFRLVDRLDFGLGYALLRHSGELKHDGEVCLL